MRIITWNVRLDCDGDWPERRAAFEAILPACRADLVCTQEPYAGQVRDFTAMLGDLPSVGVGRDDGQAAGEHCATFYDPRSVELLDQQTFWLSDTPDVPSGGWDVGGLRRICTWARVRVRGGRPIVIANTHFPLREEAKVPAAELIVRRLDAIDGDEPIVLCGDFNSTPGSATWETFGRAGFQSSADRIGIDPGPTFTGKEHKGDCRIDEVFVRGRWQVESYTVLRDAPNGQRPSDHFGLQVDLTPQ